MALCGKHNFRIILQILKSDTYFYPFSIEKLINYLNCSCKHITFAFHPYIQKLLLQYSNAAKDNEIQFSSCLSLIVIYRSNEKMPLGLILV